MVLARAGKLRASLCLYCLNERIAKAYQIHEAVDGILTMLRIINIILQYEFSAKNTNLIDYKDLFLLWSNQGKS